ncbi:MAG TPA: LptE family protein [Candidatus Cloacimonadota bacterium]|nr:LptE family protein [Candidatus Cloacimonadota bacterium]
MVKRIIYMLCLTALLSGCAYSVYSNAYPHLKKIRVTPFENKSSDYTIGDFVLNRLTTEFRDDGRLKLVTQAPDCTLEGSILSFTEKIYSYDSANQVQDYQLNLTVAVVFTDLISNQAIYENKNLTVSELYAVGTESSARFKTKEEAQIELIRTLFKTVIQNSLEAW